MMLSSSRTTRAAEPVDAAQFLTFCLDEDVFALDIRAVREIIQHGSLTTVPLMPRYVRGVMNLRGAVVPVLDLSARLGRPPAAVSKKTCIIIFEAMRDGERTELGLMVDAVREVLALAPDEVEPPPDFGGGVRREFIAGMGKIGERFVIIPAPDRAFEFDDVQGAAEIDVAAVEAV